MKKRRLGKSGFDVSEIGFGAWALGGGWGDQKDEDSRAALRRYLDLGGNFIDTAQAYGDGRSERIIGEVLRETRAGAVVATKLPPRKGRWGPPSWTPLDEVFPPRYVVEGVDFSLQNLRAERIDIYQLHTWCETWNTADELLAALEKLKKDGKVAAVGISTTESYPECVIGALRTGVIDSLQVIFNLFEQHPRDSIFPVCREEDVGIIVRVPFDEGVLTGKFTAGTTFSETDFRRHYFRGNNLAASIERVEVLRRWKEANYPDGTLADLALAWVLSHDDVGSVIPGIRNVRQADLNTAAAKMPRLSAETLRDLKKYAWRRNPWVDDLPMLADLRDLPEADLPGVARTGW
ncbi:MAG: aldo/keto reductase [Planctomycetes bacterium]|nr:aldo/keto reductase [Planctomycetota bacterium]